MCSKQTIKHHKSITQKIKTKKIFKKTKKQKRFKKTKLLFNIEKMSISSYIYLVVTLFLV